MPHRLQLQELAKKTADCSNTPCTHTHMHTHTHTAGFRSKRIRWRHTYTHKPPRVTTHYTLAHTFTPSGHICAQPLSNQDIAEFCWVARSDTGQVDQKHVQKVLWFCYRVCAFISPVRMKPIPSALWSTDQSVSVAQSIESRNLTQRQILSLVLTYCLFW